ncbi:GntR family transcriptional regulator/MocR family aminotransferase [Paucibacter oligotrophus]|uniref:GntR family transcriptional regulator/MocR family aminotransferase n=1 Tax=Roseateles oligotrophus TaxID=1769250 RepID=A0A840L4W2_9BURK|nr:PLP-dependent aminotransferase family protein [Roseateles oligotrophus]MBB4841863.1 GntR family transcriptional regulator/MocR family aminotransferase [Roseateles oligotrophus]
MGPISSRATLTLEPDGLRLDGRQGLARSLHAQLKQKILLGQLAAAQRLPASRDLAQRLGVSRNTVLRAYEQLMAEGLLEGHPGAGCYVAQLRREPPPTAARTPAQAAGFEESGQASELWARLQSLHLTPPLRPGERGLRWGLPAQDKFPHILWSRLQQRFWRRHPQLASGYADPAGLPRLRALIAAYLNSSRGLACTPEQVLLSAGSQQAIAIAALALLNPGDRVAMESPGYRAAAAALGLGGAQVLPLPLDSEGLRIGALEALGDCRMAYITPSHQFPSGVVMSAQRRLDLLAWAQRHQAYLLEDDYDGEYRYAGVPLAPLASLSGAQQRVLYIGTFSKLLFPGLRLGYMVAPKAWVPTLAKLRAVLDRQSSIVDQHVLADFIEEGHFLRHVRRMRRTASARRDTFIRAWERELDGILPLPSPLIEAGLQLLLRLPNPHWEQCLLKAAQAKGLEIGGLRQVGGLASHSQEAGLVLGFAATPEAQLEAVVADLAQCWRPVLAGLRRKDEQ